VSWRAKGLEELLEHALEEALVGTFVEWMV
jgi:hypothetical protein